MLWQDGDDLNVNKQYLFLFMFVSFTLTHWDQEKHKCICKKDIIVSDNGLSPVRSQAIIWTSAGLLPIWSLGINSSEIWIKTQQFSFKKLWVNMSTAKCRPYCLGLNVFIMRSVNTESCNSSGSSVNASKKYFTVCSPQNKVHGTL